MKALTDEQTAALVELRRALPDRTMVLIGAAGLGCHIEMTWRKTNDLDLTFVAEPDDVRAELRSLGWSDDARHRQRWTTPAGVRIDVLPASPSALREGQLVFAETGHSMNLVGFDLALSNSVQLELAPGVSFDVATVPVIVVLKMTSWQDRPDERQRDLDDLAHVFEKYFADDDVRRWDDDMVDAAIQVENQSVFALALDIVKIIDERHEKVVSAFLDIMLDESGPPHARFARCFGGRSRAKRSSLGWRRFGRVCHAEVVLPRVQFS